MAKQRIYLLPRAEEALKAFGENLRLARLRRNITSKLQAERAGISLMTLHKVEQGSPSVAIGNYLQVLTTLGMDGEIAGLSANDPLGRKLQDLGLTRARQRASRSPTK